jgi:hypothetical protein
VSIGSGSSTVPVSVLSSTLQASGPQQYDASVWSSAVRCKRLSSAVRCKRLVLSSTIQASGPQQYDVSVWSLAVQYKRQVLSSTMQASVGNSRSNKGLGLLASR